MSCAGGSSQGSWLVLGLPSLYELVIWLVVGVSTPLKNDGVKVSWDDDIPNLWKVIQNSCPNHKPVYRYRMIPTYKWDRPYYPLVI